MVLGLLADYSGKKKNTLEIFTLYFTSKSIPESMACIWALRVWSLPAWVQILVLSLTSCVTLVKMTHFISPCKMGMIIVAFLGYL